MAGPFISSLKRQVAIGPVMADTNVGAIQTLGFLTILPIWSMLVPSPCDMMPFQPFSRKLSTANPTIWAQQPARAAPPASPVRLNAAQMAAELIGRVSAIPTITDTKIPIRNGCLVVAHIMTFPRLLAAEPMPGAHQYDRPIPTAIVTRGVTRISILVSLETALPNSDAKMVTT